MEIRISVIIPIYNAAATLRAAAESVLSQDVEGLELLLVDDGSTDGTAEVCHALAVQDARVQVIAQKKRRHLRRAQPRAAGGLRYVHRVL